MGEKTIYRVARRTTHFAQIANAMLRDTRLSIEARGALSLIMSYPEDWEITPEWLSGLACVGRDKARAILRELIDHNYCARSQSRENRATFGTCIYLFTDTPGTIENVSQDGASPCPEKPSTVPPQTDLPAPDAPSPQNTSETNTIEGTNTVGSNTPLPPEGGKPTPTDALKAFDAYNAVALRCGLPQAAKLTKDRQRKIIARLKDYGLDGWSQALANLEKSAYCQGRNDRGWRADLEFMCQASSFSRLHDGGYGNGAHTPAKSQSSDIFAAARAAEAAKGAAAQ